MVNTFAARTINWSRLDGNIGSTGWMDTSVSCTQNHIMDNNNSVHKCLFSIHVAVCVMESTQLTAFHKVAFCPLVCVCRFERAFQ